MNLSEQGRLFIQEREALRLEAYKDSVGIWTIGWGHTIGVREGDICTTDQAQDFFEQDLQPVEDCINSMVKVDLEQGQFDALCSFVFNLGCTALRNSTLLRKLNAGDIQGAAEEFGKWNHAKGEVLPGLTKRREQERQMFAGGERADGLA